MRDFKGMKRQRGRNRGGGGGGGGGKPQQNANRAFDSNGPDGVKVRGNAQHVFEKYQQLARDAHSSGDRVLAENYLQHAEHYFRLLRAMQPQRPASEILGRDQFASGFDIDFEDEGGAAQASDGENEGGDGESENGRERNGWQARDERPRDDNRRDDRARDDRPRDDRPRNDVQRNEGQRNEGQRVEGQRTEGRRDRWRDDRPREDRPREDRPREDRYRDDRPRGERESRPERDPLAVVEPQAQIQAPAPTPVEDRPGPVLRDSDGGESHAPAFLQNRAEPKAEAAAPKEEGVPRPRRRRAPRSFDGGAEGTTPPSETEEV